MQLHILAHHGDAHSALGMADALHHFAPLRHIRGGRLDLQLAADDIGQMRLLQHQRGFVQDRQGGVFDHAVRADVAEVGDLADDRRILDLFIRAQHDDIGVHAHALQLLHGVLGGLGFMLARGAQVGHQGNVDVQRVVGAHLAAYLADGLDEGLAFDIARGAAHLGDDHVRVGLFAYLIDEVLDFIGHMGNDLHRAAQVFAPALAAEHTGEHLAGGEVGVFIQILVDKALIVSKVQVGFRAVLGYIHLAVLDGAHGAGVYVDVGVQLLRCDLESPVFEQTAQRRRRNALAQARYHAAGYEDVLCHM